MKKFPVFNIRAPKVCFNCGGVLIHQVRDSGNPPGHGQYCALCSCGYTTYFDVKRD